MALYKEELDHMHCGIPECKSSHGGQMFLHSQCHIKAGTEVSYDPSDGGELLIACAECKKEIVRIQVASLGRVAM